MDWFGGGMRAVDPVDNVHGKGMLSQWGADIGRTAIFIGEITDSTYLFSDAGLFKKVV